MGVSDLEEIVVCRNCNQAIQYKNEDTFWDERGYGYSIKLVRCPKCGHISVIKYVEDTGLNVNFDDRYYL